jgi:hypothetical protein
MWLQVLQMACQKYNEYITNLLAPGVAAAYYFQRGLWSAKHRGQPLPKSEHAHQLHHRTGHVWGFDGNKQTAG